MLCLLDFSQIVISSAVDYFSKTQDKISINLLRHISLNNILAYKKKFKVDNNRLIICCDGRDYWRKSIFSHYKQNRKKEHEKSTFDWETFFKDFNQIKLEVQTELPFPAIEVERCEADDLISVISQINCPHENRIIIISSDKDLIQIQNLCPKVEQWSPFHKKLINSSTNDYNLFEHVIRGDKGDGIPNIFSDDDVFVTNKRSKPIKASNVLEWKNLGGLNCPENFCPTEEVMSKFKRNRTLIDLTQIPEDIVKTISETYHQIESNVNSNNIFDYLVKNKLRKLLEQGFK
jgi:TusA-related sulfurtransferase